MLLSLTASKPYALHAGWDSASEAYVAWIKTAKPLPEALPMIVSDMVHHLRSSLDSYASPNLDPNGTTAFQWLRDLSNFDTHKRIPLTFGVATAGTLHVVIPTLKWSGDIDIPHRPLAVGSVLAKWTIDDLPPEFDYEYDLNARGTIDVPFARAMPESVRFHSVRDTLIQVYRWLLEKLFPKFDTPLRVASTRSHTETSPSLARRKRSPYASICIAVKPPSATPLAPVRPRAESWHCVAGRRTEVQ
ncbi:hypothetical protein [Gemmatimonas sp.]|uniref:hypothetical protein n=1 Tax=Gemmatimonas sp. TaxID=1962908 RepID=UPI0039830FA1